jgi:hypothetical protein
MERRPLIYKPSMSFKDFVRGLPFIIGLMITLFIIGYGTSGLTMVALMFIALIVFAALHFRANTQFRILALLKTPCPQCGHSPMKYDRSLEGDCVFTCDKCQIEWTLPSSGQNS